MQRPLPPDIALRTVLKMHTNKEKKEELLDALKREKAARVPKNQPYLSIADATALFDIGRDSLYRLIRNKQVRYYNLGLRMIRICKADLQERFNLRPYDERRKEKQSELKTYRLEPEDCYTIGEIAKKVYIRRNPRVAEAIKQAETELDSEELRNFEEKMYGDVWDKERYLNWMYENLVAIKAVMSDTASILCRF